MSELTFVPDLRNTGERVRRLLWTVAIGALVGLVAGWIMYLVVDPSSVESESVTMEAGGEGAWGLVGYVAGGVGFIGGTIAFVVHRRLAERRARALPRARVRAR